jgi:ATP-dependent Clp protease adaptor protein ClpS
MELLSAGPTITPTREVEQAPAPQLDRGEPELASDSPWHVVLLDDDAHTYDYVIEMLGAIFGYSLQKAFAMACEVDTRKRVIVWTGHLERAEAYQESIHSYGADWRMDTSQGSMSAILQQAR